MEKGHFFQRSWNYERNRLNKDLKKKNFQKRPNEFNLDKSPGYDLWSFSFKQ